MVSTGTTVGVCARFAIAAAAFAGAWRGAGRVHTERVTHATPPSSEATPRKIINDSYGRPRSLSRSPEDGCLEEHLPAEHARRLLAWLQEPGGLTGPILARELQVIHQEMCADIGWNMRPWNPIGHQLAMLLSGGRKTWAWVADPKTGRRHRLRVYQIPRAAVTATTPAPLSEPTPSTVPTPGSWSRGGSRLAA